ncbi:nuclear transport factor 2 family protein [Streptomyces lonegramiae]|uniref:Nuclear transport factor 2 family protein n=1 Tax=Streptomyces lonegramiae TaxID=3075524 RepID=A0ABU2XUR2_9ACTN|nr:nuclear transport factor 2 family protein [Streptomyces sp. DSM 41529]MDT0549663.1 nuclear transport factor 2 family protein [Streptomyces sp. DSM 41529]
MAATTDTTDVMTTERTRATVQEFLTRMAAGDLERLGALFAERVDWLIAENPDVPWIRPRSTRADAVAHFRELAESLAPDPDGNTIDAIVVEGTEAMVTGVLAGTVRATGKPYRSPFAVRVTVEDGLITRYRVYEDSRMFAAACTPDA